MREPVGRIQHKVTQIVEAEFQISTAETHLKIGLAAWIIADGNYNDFAVGDRSRFALEFYSQKGLSITNDACGFPRLTHQRDSLYTAHGIVRFVSKQAWAIDFGTVMAFRDEKPPKKMKHGVSVSGEIYLGIDPFFYYERLFLISKMPPLIYEWQIDGIEKETSPFVESSDPRMERVLIRDPAKRGRISVQQTDAWNDDGGHGDYVLSCRRLSTEAFRRP